MDSDLRWEILETVEFLNEMNNDLQTPKRPKRQRRAQYTHPIQTFKVQSICSICLDSFNEYQEVSITKCGHQYHSKCIKLVGAGRQSCPLCREMIYIK